MGLVDSQLLCGAREKREKKKFKRVCFLKTYLEDFRQTMENDSVWISDY